MDILSLVPAVGSLVVVPVALGLTIRFLAGDPENDAVPSIATPFVVGPMTQSGPAVSEVEFVPFRFDRPSVDGAPAAHAPQVTTRPVALVS
jgi:hypothetical protein